MIAFLRSMFALGCCCFSGMVACTHFDAARSSSGNEEEPSGLSAKEVEIIRRQLVAHPLPEAPVYQRTGQACIFFVRNPSDASMLPVGMLEKHAYVVVRAVEGEWSDVQLTSGQLGSVLTVNLRQITEDEDASEDYLLPQPGLEPLPWPQASRDETEGLDAVLLGG